MDKWLLVPILIVGGFLLGTILSRIVHSIVGSPKRPEALQQVARPLSSLAFAVGVVLGLIAAVGILAPGSLDDLPRDVVAFVPKVLMAAIIIIVANVLVTFATAALDQALGRMPLQVQRQASLVVKAFIFIMAALLAVSQLGVDTEVVNMALGAVFFGMAASLTLLVGLGGNSVAREVASTRALKRLISQGDAITVGGVSGVVRAVHPTAVEIAAKDGETVLVPSSTFINTTVTIERTDVPAGAEPMTV